MNRVALLLRKDVLVLRRSPLLLGVLLAYPLRSRCSSASSRATRAPSRGSRSSTRTTCRRPSSIGGHRFHVDRTIRQVSRNVKLVRLSPEDAARQLRTGKVVAVVTVPPGLRRHAEDDGAEPDARARALARHVSVARRAAGAGARLLAQPPAPAAPTSSSNLRYVTLILNGGNGSFLGQHVQRARPRAGAEAARADAPDAAGADSSADFVHDARLALANTGDALRATAHPIELVRRAGTRPHAGCSRPQVQAYALGLTITFLALCSRPARSPPSGTRT